MRHRHGGRTDRARTVCQDRIISIVTVLLAWLRRNWFLPGLALAMVLAWPLASVETLVADHAGRRLAEALVALVFLFSGVALASETLRHAGRRWPLHLGIQVTSLMLLPVAAWVLLPLWRFLLDEVLLVQGLLVVACLPTTITGCVIFTRMAGGSEAVALINAVLGNLLGIVVAPASILLLTGLHGSVTWPVLMGQLLVITALPLAVGQILRWRWRPGQVAGRRLATAAQATLLTIICLTLARSLAQHGLPHSGILLGLVFACIALRLLLLVLSWPMTLLLGRDHSERRAVLFTASEKTMALGVPLLSVALAGDPRLGLLLLPLVVFHPLQLLIDGIVSDRLGRSGRAAQVGNAAAP